MRSVAMVTQNETKCVIVVDENLPLGLIANTAAILGITLGKNAPELVGLNASDASGQSHLGISTLPVPVLKGTSSAIRELRCKLCNSDYADVMVADFSDIAQSCNVYSEYLRKAAATEESDHSYFGLALYGNKKKINRLTGSMPLLR
jgi:hypothetical protein